MEADVEAKMSPEVIDRVVPPQEAGPLGGLYNAIVITNWSGFYLSCKIKAF